MKRIDDWLTVFSFIEAKLEISESGDVESLMLTLFDIAGLKALVI